MSFEAWAEALSAALTLAAVCPTLARANEVKALVDNLPNEYVPEEWRALRHEASDWLAMVDSEMVRFAGGTVQVRAEASLPLDMRRHWARP